MVTGMTTAVEKVSGVVVESEDGGLEWGLMERVEEAAGAGEVEEKGRRRKRMAAAAAAASSTAALRRSR